ncbi:hypothetical protein R7Q10_21810 [Vibrio sp. Vb0599]|uniref:hypothetical protein n=1 Tax=Vibrio sp. Vb0599 TaxID=3074628 RepID=UPI002964F663|nr:hypothetical protein [Vibrio sp. Vb0599]MDW1944668.1 hypothetical protein [Vibrio sp. Vb0599]
MEDLHKKYEMLLSKLEPKKQEKLDELVNEWLPIYKQNLYCVLANTDYVIEQSPKLIPAGGGLQIAKMRFQAYIKDSQTSKVILLDVGFNAYKNKPEKERMPYLNNWLQRSLSPPKRQKPVKTLSERFTKMIKDYDSGYDMGRHLPTLHEVNRLLRPHLKTIMTKNLRCDPAVYDWKWCCTISLKQINDIIENLTD